MPLCFVLNELSKRKTVHLRQLYPTKDCKIKKICEETLDKWRLSDIMLNVS